MDKYDFIRFIFDQDLNSNSGIIPRNSHQLFFEHNSLETPVEKTVQPGEYVEHISTINISTHNVYSGFSSDLMAEGFSNKFNQHPDFFDAKTPSFVKSSTFIKGEGIDYVCYRYYGNKSIDTVPYMSFDDLPNKPGVKKYDGTINTGKAIYIDCPFIHGKPSGSINDLGFPVYHTRFTNNTGSPIVLQQSCSAYIFRKRHSIAQSVTPHIGDNYWTYEFASYVIDGLLDKYGFILGNDDGNRNISDQLDTDITQVLGKLMVDWYNITKLRLFDTNKLINFMIYYLY